MAKESQIQKRARLGKILESLARAYPDAHCELNYRNPLELLIATILSAQCTDKQVNLVTETLFQRYKTAADFAEAPLEELEQAIRRIGLFRSKARNIQLACRRLVELYQGEVPRTMEALTALAGVGRKTANVVLGNAYGINVGVVVDTHVARLSERLGITRETDPVKIETVLMSLVDPVHWTLVSHWLIWHGRRRCGARNPDCAACEIRQLCPAPSRPSRAQPKRSKSV